MPTAADAYWQCFRHCCCKMHVHSSCAPSAPPPFPSTPRWLQVSSLAGVCWAQHPPTPPWAEPRPRRPRLAGDVDPPPPPLYITSPACTCPAGPDPAAHPAGGVCGAAGAHLPPVSAGLPPGRTGAADASWPAAAAVRQSGRQGLTCLCTFSGIGSMPVTPHVPSQGGKVYAYHCPILASLPPPLGAACRFLLDAQCRCR